MVFALSHFQAVPHTGAIAEITEQIGLSQTRFVQVFREEVGLTPKLFCRIQRFQQALRHVESHPLMGCPVDWVKVALDCGYYDQAHFIHDFRAFSGINPSAYLIHRNEDSHHVWLGD